MPLDVHGKGGLLQVRLTSKPWILSGLNLLGCWSKHLKICPYSGLFSGVLVSTSIKRTNYYGYQIDDSPINRTRMSLTALEGQCSKTPPWKHCIHLENICVSGFSHIFRKSVYIQKAFKFQVKAPLTRPLALPSLGQAALSVCRELSQLPPRSLPFFTTSLLRRRHVFQDMVGCVDSKKLYNFFDLVTIVVQYFWTITMQYDSGSWSSLLWWRQVLLQWISCINQHHVVQDHIYYPHFSQALSTLGLINPSTTRVYAARCFTP